ncbi:hypothetical protein BDR07DRAFT_1477465 [Suillus spraguei]|nr:hypothetical protein BDR07DRAFT_1477465 [Suillus spraguei]
MQVIVSSRLYAVYRRSRKMLVFLVATFLPIAVACGVLTAIVNSHVLGEQQVLSGTYLCIYRYEQDARLLISTTWILSTVWAAIILCLVGWIVVKHFRELQQPSTRWTISDCFRVLINTPMIYLVSIVVYSLGLGDLSPNLFYSSSVGSDVYYGILQILSFVQMFVLAPRLILNVREYEAKNLAVNSDSGPSFTTIIFQEHDLVSTGSDV